MRWRNDTDHYGLVAISLHWLMALAIFGMFGLGLWMTGLTYYDRWYNLGPWWHKGIGVLLFAALALRLIWRWSNPGPQPISTHKPWERIAAGAAHVGLYLLLFAVMLSGYLISTADGRALEVFDWFAIPATIHSLTDQADIAGVVHLWLASGVIGLATIHALAALKHHFIDHDRTLKRIFGR